MEDEFFFFERVKTLNIYNGKFLFFFIEFFF